MLPFTLRPTFFWIPLLILVSGSVSLCAPTSLPAVYLGQRQKRYERDNSDSSTLERRALGDLNHAIGSALEAPPWLTGVLDSAAERDVDKVMASQDELQAAVQRSRWAQKLSISASGKKATLPRWIAEPLDNAARDDALRVVDSQRAMDAAVRRNREQNTLRLKLERLNAQRLSAKEKMAAEARLEAQRARNAGPRSRMMMYQQQMAGFDKQIAQIERRLEQDRPTAGIPVPH